MNLPHASTLPVFAVALCFFVAGAIAPPVFGQRSSSSKYAKGDRVEVEEGAEWRPGTVVSTNRRTGWIEVRLDEDDMARRVPKSMRAEMLTSDFLPSNVRPLANAETVTVSRTWTDRSGKFKIEAQFGGMEGASVVLIKAGGKAVNVPLEKLSDRDKLYVKEQSEPTENPFGEESEAASAAAGVKKANLREVKNVRPQTFSKWSFTPTGKTEQMLAAAGSRDVEVQLSDIPDSDKFFEKVDGIHVSGDGHRIVVGRTKGAVGQDKQQYLQVVDVAKQRAGALVALPELTTVLDVEPGQNLVMYRPEIFGHGENSLLTLARLDGDALTPMIAWEPYAHEDWEPSRDIESAQFVGPDRVMTINGHGKALTVWDTKTAKALLNIPVAVSFTLKMAISPDRTLLAVVMKDGIAIIDLSAGQHVATIQTAGRDFDQVEFRADNARLAGLSGHGVTVWDLATGKELSEFSSMAMGHRPSLAWAGNFLLAENRYLFDVERRVLLWEYQGAPGSGISASLRNGRLYVIPNMSRDSDTDLVSAALPHRAALEEAKQLPSAEELLVVRPGDEVALEVDIDPSVALTEEVRKALTAKLQTADSGADQAANVVVLQPGAAQGDLIRQALTAGLQEAGFKVVERSDLVVKAVCKPQPQQTIKVNVDGRWPPRPEDIQERTVTPHASYLEMSLKGEALWKRGFIAQPFMTIWMNQGETLDQALQRLTQPNLTIFTQAKFSPYVAKPGKATPNGAYGVSQFTTRGIVDGGPSGNQRAAFE